MSPREWEEAPWWEQRLLIEGLQDQEIIGTPDDADPDVTVEKQGSTTITNRKTVVDMADDAFDPAAFGFSTGTI